MVWEDLYQKIPKNVNIHYFTCVGSVDSNNLSLDVYYNKPVLSEDGIQLITYGESKRNININLLSPNHAKLLNKKRFNNCVIFYFKNQSIRLFGNGKFQIVGMYDLNITKSNVTKILGDVKILSLSPVLFNYNISIPVDIGILREKLLQCDNIKYKKYVHRIICKYKNNTINIFPNTVIYYSNSYDDINDVVNFIGKLVGEIKTFCWYKPWSWY